MREKNTKIKVTISDEAAPVISPSLIIKAWFLTHALTQSCSVSRGLNKSQVLTEWGQKIPDLQPHCWIILTFSDCGKFRPFSFFNIFHYMLPYYYNFFFCNRLPFPSNLHSPPRLIIARRILCYIFPPHLTTRQSTTEASQRLPAAMRMLICRDDIIKDTWSPGIYLLFYHGN